MAEFLPSTYGPADVVATIGSWLADDTMVAQARAGVGLNYADAYEQIEPRMVEAPEDLMVAYEQAAYFLALGVRRLIRLGIPNAAVDLKRRMEFIVREGNMAEAEAGIVCSMTGLWCPARGAPAVLRDAIEGIEESALPDEDRVQLVTILKRNRRAVQLQQALPWIALAGIGTAVGLYMRQRKSRT